LRNTQPLSGGPPGPRGLTTRRLAKLFRDEAQRLQTAPRSELVALEHVVTTAVPGLAAEPVIDIVAASAPSNWLPDGRGASSSLVRARPQALAG